MQGFKQTNSTYKVISRVSIKVHSNAFEVFIQMLLKCLFKCF
jgi:hypothetical protein